MYICSMFSVSCQIICQLHDMNKKDEVFRSSMFIFYTKKGGHGDRYRNWYIHCFLAGGTGLMITSWVNVEHARLILPPHFVTRLAINGSKVFIGFDTMIQRGSVLGNHLFLRIFHGA